MMTSAAWLALLLIAGAEETQASARPPADPSSQERSRQEEVARLAPAQANRLDVYAHDTKPEKASLHSEPLLRWSNPTAGSVHGEVYLWTQGARPLAIASIYRWYHPYRDATVEFVSVSEQKIEAREGSKSHWNTRSPGIRYKPVPEADAPAPTRGARLAQMRLLARRFAAVLTDERGGDEVVRELRLLNQPVHRYVCPEHKIVDGVLFAFVEGTDPEAWLLLEAVESDAGKSWRYALARMNIDALEVRLDGKAVHRWSNLRDAWTDRTTPYVMFNFDPEQLARKTLPPESPKWPLEEVR